MNDSIELFPIKIKGKLLDSLNREKIKEVINYIESTEGSDVLTRKDSRSGSWSANQNFLNLDFLSDVKLEVLEFVKQYSLEEKHRCENIEIVSSWFNSINRHDVIRPHIHPNSYISGVIHLTYGAPLCFHKPTVEDRFRIFMEKDFNPQEDIVQLECVAGQVVLFPSSLEHSVAEHTADYSRHSIAFNTWPRVYGHDTARVNLK